MPESNVNAGVNLPECPFFTGSGCRNAFYTGVNLPENSPSGGVKMPGTGGQDRRNGGSGCTGVYIFLVPPKFYYYLKF
jgi:hypothetical protein